MRIRIQLITLILHLVKYWVGLTDLVQYRIYVPIFRSYYQAWYCTIDVSSVLATEQGTSPLLLLRRSDR